MLILASRSPRRADLLTQMGVEFCAHPAEIDESVWANEAAVDYVQRIATTKAGVVRHRFPSQPVLGSDTAVVLDDRILGKPSSRTEGMDMLMALSGRTHQVLSGVALIVDERHHYRLSTSHVRFRAISTNEAASYWATGEPTDKAGGYAIQGRAAAFVEPIEGSYSGIMGLPLFETMELLSQIGLRDRCGV